MDMSVLVAAQGELLNQIDSHVASAVDNTNQAAVEMKDAVKIQRASKKKIMIIIGLHLTSILIDRNRACCYYRWRDLPLRFCIKYKITKIYDHH
jgi:hypothetical protein